MNVTDTMSSKNFNQCSYTFRRGKIRGHQCTKPTDFGFCSMCLVRTSLRGNISMDLLVENIIASNSQMIDLCLDQFIYSYNEMFDVVIPLFHNGKILTQWLNSKSQDFFIIKYWLCSHINLIKDVIGLINHHHYYIQYNEIFDILADKNKD